jgi:tripartite ATP-independent transporter DctP family solute receptor
MQLTRRKFALGAAAGAVLPSVLIPRSPARAAEFTLNIGMSITQTHTAVQHLLECSKRMAAESNGRIDLRVFPSSQMGGEMDMMTQVHSGALQFQLVGGSMINNIVPVAGINAVGFVFKNYDEIWAAMDGELGARIRRDLAKGGFFCHDRQFDNGYRQLTTTRRQIKHVDDLKGLKVRLPVGPVWTSLWTALGASPTSIDLSEVYSALQTGVVDGQENSLEMIESNKIYEVQKYCALTSHMWDGWWIIGHPGTWNALPDDMKEILSRNLTKSAMEERVAIRANAQKTQDHLASLGLTFNEPDRDSFRQKLQGTSYYKDWRKKYGDEAWEILEHYVGKLT